MCGIFLLLVGPSTFLGLPDSKTLLIIGLFLTSSTFAPLVIPVLPETVAVTKEQNPSHDLVSINNMNGALLNSFLGVGQCIGPIYGALMYEATGFRVAQDLLAVCFILSAVNYFLFADGKEALAGEETVRLGFYTGSPKTSEGAMNTSFKGFDNINDDEYVTARTDTDRENS
jgi:MFS family permease